ncbi:MAG TPA: Wzz/FepE/Etk N-terminal domain-containing protein [Candidatus Sulfotelmatobacter sp.]|nr:Wzz/FepE/Etk N-terminal domain-containing protein [Candidatus Sulfotelmatobacter sp.]
MSQQISDDEIDLSQYYFVFARRWKTIGLFAVGLAVIVLIISLLQSPVYEAKTTILFKTGGGGGLSQYAGVAGMLGVNINAGGDIGDITELLKSRVVAAKVLDDLKLTQRIKGWDSPRYKRQDLVTYVNKMLKPPKINGNIVEVMVEAGEPQLTADLANGFIDALAYYWNALNFSATQNKLKYIETELPRVEKDLRTAENKLRLAPVSAAGLPLGDGQGGVQRDYYIYNSVYTMLRKEYESDKLEAAKDILPFSVIDQAEKPLSKSKPKIKQNVLVGLFLGLFVGILYAFGQEYWEKSDRRTA